MLINGSYEPGTITRDRLPFRCSQTARARAAFDQGDEERLWVTMSQMFDAGDVSLARVLLVGFERDDRLSVRKELRQIGVNSIAQLPHPSMLPEAAKLGSAISHIIVDMTAIGQIQDAVEALTSFRKIAPSLCVVLVSQSVACDDFGSERNAICDVTLRAPLSSERLRRGLLEASARHA
jgi:hypothetical protein